MSLDHIQMEIECYRYVCMHVLNMKPPEKDFLNYPLVLKVIRQKPVQHLICYPRLGELFFFWPLYFDMLDLFLSCYGDFVHKANVYQCTFFAEVKVHCTCL